MADGMRNTVVAAILILVGVGIIGSGVINDVVRSSGFDPVIGGFIVVILVLAGMLGALYHGFKSMNFFGDD